MEHLTHLSATWTDSRPHPRIVNQLAGGIQYNINLFNTVVLRQRGEEAVKARCREPFIMEVSAAMWSSYGQLTVNLNRRVSDGIMDMKNISSLQVFKTTV
jgi:hypothetical protein